MEQFNLMLQLFGIGAAVVLQGRREQLLIVATARLDGDLFRAMEA